MPASKAAAVRTNATKTPSDAPKASAPRAPKAPAPGSLLQTFAPPAAPVQRKRHAGTDRALEEPVHRKADGAAHEEPHAAAASARAALGAGRPLDTETRRSFEGRLGASLADVRIHDDPRAGDAARAMNARAYTVGHDIAFAPGEYSPHSEAGEELLAHELTHVVQNRAGVATKRAVSDPSDASEREADAVARAITKGGRASPIAGPSAGVQRAKNSATTTAKAGAKAAKTSAIPTVSGNRLVFEAVAIPAFKANAAHSKKLYDEALAENRLVRTRGLKRPNDQVRVFLDAVGTMGTNTVGTWLGTISAKEPLALRYKATPIYFFGAKNDLKTKLLVPRWTAAGKPANFAVDHIVEIQLSNWPSNKDANAIGNMQLLEERANSSSGSSIDKGIKQQVADAIAAFKDKVAGPKATPPGKTAPKEAPATPATADEAAVAKLTEDDVLANYDLVFKDYVGVGDATADIWLPGAIGTEAYLKGLALDPKLTEGGTVHVSSGKFSGYVRGFTWDETTKKPDLTGKVKDYLKPFEIVDYAFDTSSAGSPQLGSITVKVPSERTTGEGKKQDKWRSKVAGASGGTPVIPVRRIEGFNNVGFIGDAELKSLMGSLVLAELSPLAPTEVEFGANGIIASGKILTDVAILKKGIDIGFELQGDDLAVAVTFTAGDISLPSPFHVDRSTLTVSYGTHGFGLRGEVAFGIDRVGTGTLGAKKDAKGFAVDGAFHFDPSLFGKRDIQADLRFGYRDGAFSGGGHVAIGKGAVPGVSKGSLDVSYAKGTFAAKGSAELDVPGVKSVDLGIEVSDTEGLTLSGDAKLADNIPGIQEGSVKVRLHRKEKDAPVELYAEGWATPKIPGVNSKLHVVYDNGVFDAFVQASIEYKRFKGGIGIGVTNRPMAADGSPLPPPAKDDKKGATTSAKLTAYGSGFVTVRFAEWLEGTAGLKVLPSGQMEVSGRIAIPKSLTLFKALDFDKKIFSFDLDIPIFGPVVVGMGVGASASGGVGPGTLEDAHLDVTYNPDDDSKTQVGGGARVHVPAYFGVTVYAEGHIGVSILVASLKGFIRAKARLGLEGAVDAGVDVNWSPAKGLVIDAAASIYVQPALKFDLVLGYTARALFWSHEHEYPLKSYDIGSGLRVGVKFPVHYEQGKPFSISTDKLEFDVPKIDPLDVIPRLVRAARGGKSDDDD